MNTFLLRFVACLFLCVSLNSFGALSIRDLDGDWSNGHEGVYDDVLDITWLADANYAQSSGYDTANNINILGGDGKLTWQGANAFTQFLSDASMAGSMWRLPTLDFTDSCMQFNGRVHQGFQCGNTLQDNHNELGYHFYQNFGALENNSILSGNNLLNISMFSNINEFAYFVSHVHHNAVGFFFTDTGLQSGAYTYGYDGQLVWPVHDGDIGLAPVPLPAGIWLFGSALAGLLVARRKNKK